MEFPHKTRNSNWFYEDAYAIIYIRIGGRPTEKI